MLCKIMIGDVDSGHEQCSIFIVILKYERVIVKYLMYIHAQTFMSAYVYVCSS